MTAHQSHSSSHRAGVPGVRELSHTDAWTRLRSMVVGRIAFTLDGRIELFPVNYLVDHGTILFRTGVGSKLAASMERLAAVFEVDGYEAESGEAWSVVARGHLEPVLDTAGIVEASALPLFPWQAGEKAFFVRVVPEDVTGRQFPVAAPETWVTPFTGMRRASEE